MVTRLATVELNHTTGLMAAMLPQAVVQRRDGTWKELPGEYTGQTYIADGCVYVETHVERQQLQRELATAEAELLDTLQPLGVDAAAGLYAEEERLRAEHSALRTSLNAAKSERERKPIRDAANQITDTLEAYRASSTALRKMESNVDRLRAAVEGLEEVESISIPMHLVARIKWLKTPRTPRTPVPLPGHRAMAPQGDG